MRLFLAGGGLVGLLLAIGLYVYIRGESDSATLQAGKQAQDRSQQISGRDEQGTDVRKTFTLADKAAAGSRPRFVFDKVNAGEGAEVMWGIKAGDELVSIADLAVGSLGTPDAQNLADQILAAYQGGKPIEVRRGGQKVTLPAKKQLMPGLR